MEMLLQGCSGAMITSSRKRKQPYKREDIDTKNLHYYTSNKRQRTEELATRDREIALLNDIIDYHNKNQTYPFDDDEDLRKFYNGWIKGRGVYENMVEVSKKMYKMYSRYMKSSKNPMFIIKMLDIDETHPNYCEIFKLSNSIWNSTSRKSSVVAADYSDGDHNESSSDIVRMMRAIRIRTC